MRLAGIVLGLGLGGFVDDMPFHVPAYDWLFLAVGGVGFSLIGLLMAPGTRELPPRADQRDHE
jgi:hypothetical protein